jgi:hypothetical protein
MSTVSYIRGRCKRLTLRVKTIESVAESLVRLENSRERCDIRKIETKADERRWKKRPASL